MTKTSLLALSLTLGLFITPTLARAEAWTECQEGDSFPTDGPDYNHVDFSTRVGFLVYYVLDSEGMHVNEIPLDELKTHIVKEEITSTTPTRTYLKRQIGFDRIINSFYRDGQFYRIPLTPPVPLMNPRLFSCIDYKI